MITARPAILVTRPEPDDAETAARLEAIGFSPRCAPLMQLATLDTGLPDAAGLGGIVLTSANAIRALDTRGETANFLHLPVFAVGERTAAFASDAGFGAVTSADGDFDDLVALLSNNKPGGPLFYPCASRVQGDLARALAPKGIMVIATRIYEMCAVKSLPPDVLEDLKNGNLTCAVFYSRRTAEIFCALAAPHLSDRQRQGLHMLCLSENVAAPLIEHHFTRIALADYPSEEAMMSLALSFTRGQIR